MTSSLVHDFQQAAMPPSSPAVVSGLIIYPGQNAPNQLTAVTGSSAVKVGAVVNWPRFEAAGLGSDLESTGHGVATDQIEIGSLDRGVFEKTDAGDKSYAGGYPHDGDLHLTRQLVVEPLTVLPKWRRTEHQR